ncbi:1531_t:CDS:2, partial [Cetraspora pellucida]
QLAIFIRSQYHSGTSLALHMKDLKLLTQNNHLNEILKLENIIKSIWVLLVDGDYLTVRTYAPYHSAYNSVEHSILIFLQKLAGIVLPADKYGFHLNSQGEVIDQELTKKNFKYASEVLCDLWNWDLIFG